MTWRDIPAAGKRILGGILGLFFAGIVVAIVWAILPTRSCYPEAAEAAIRALQCRQLAGQNYLSF
jgi:hypothetical protein